MRTKNKLLIIVGSVILALGLFLALSQSDKTQNTRSRAAVSETASTTLYFQPASGGTKPIQKQVGENFTLDLMVDPGDNLVSLLKIQIKYNLDKFSLSSSDPFTVNTEAFPTTVEGPIVSGDTLSILLSIGPDGTKPIQTPTKVGTLNLSAKESTNGTSTLISFTSLTTAVSIGPNDSHNESVLASTTPATIVIGGSGSNITPSVTANPSVRPTITQPVGDSTITFDLLFHGVGSAGDNPNPRGSTLSNKSPLNPQRPLEVTILDANNIPVATASGAVNYDDQSGTFKGSIPFNSGVAADRYVLKIKSPRYLRKRVPEVIEIVPGRDNRIDRIDLVAGDTNSDNRLDILDYNAFLDCGYGELNPLPNDDANSVFNSKVCQNHNQTILIDINDDGIINSTDYNLFLRELSVQTGD